MQVTVQEQNRYIGQFERSLVAVYAIIATRRNPTRLCNTDAVRRWIEMMINDDDVAEEWTARVQQRAPPAKRPRIQELE